MFHQGIDGKFNSGSYQVFLLSVLAKTTEPLFLIQDGAKYHTPKATKQFFAQPTDRLTVFQLPSYSPDYNPIEYLWRETKKRATHNRYFEQFQEIILAVVTEQIAESETEAAKLAQAVKNVKGGAVGKALQEKIDQLETLYVQQIQKRDELQVALIST